MRLERAVLRTQLGSLLLAITACSGSDAVVAVVDQPEPVAAIAIQGGDTTLLVGQTMQLTATTLGASGAPVTGRSISWSSLPASVASVSATGLVTALSPGTATISASSEGIVATRMIEVSATPVPGRLLEIVSGSNQMGLTGRALADSLVVRMRTGTGAAAAGVNVAWSADAGAISDAVSVTDIDGIARVQWVVGGGASTATATANGETATFTATGSPSGACALTPSPQTQRFSLGPTDFTLHLRATSNIRVVALFGDYADTPAGAISTQSRIDEVVVPGLQVLAQSSYGRLTIAVTPEHRWYRMPRPSTNYDWSTFQGHKDYFEDLMSLADGDVDFSQYDAIFAFDPNGSAHANSPTFSGGQTNGMIRDGTNIGNAVTFGGDSYTYGPTVLAHEMGHVLGLLDLYAYSTGGGAFYPGNQFRFVGAWSNMSNIFVGADILGWEKYKLGWLDQDQIDCLPPGAGEEVVLEPLNTVGGQKLVALQLSPSRAMVVEVRAIAGLDAPLCAGGVLIYDVDAVIPTGTGPAQVRGSRVTTSGPNMTRCGPWSDATFDLGAGKIDSYIDALAGIEVKLLAVESSGAYRVRIRR